MTTHSLAAALSMFLVATTAAAQWTTPWLPGSTLTNGAIHALAVAANGDVIAGGEFTTIEGVAANRVARWNGSTWQPLGSGLGGRVNKVLALRNGDVVVGGEFTTAGGASALRIARWNGTSWTDVGGGWPGSAIVYSLSERPDGSIAVAGSSSLTLPPFYSSMRVALWDDNTWSEVPIPPATAQLGIALAVLEGAGGELLIGGNALSGGILLRWNGVSVQTVATTMGSPYFNVANLAFGPSGELIALGSFTNIGGTAANNVASWNGATWSAFGSGLTIGGSQTNTSASALAVLPDGDVVVGGYRFTDAGGAPANGIARWDGTAWSAFGSGVTGPTAVSVQALAFLPSGPLFVGGMFTQAGGVPTTNLARIGTTCPAVSQTFGYGCGKNTLAVTSPAWANGMFRATGTGLPATSIILTVTGLTPQLPGLGMDAVFAIGIPGCDLFVAPDILGLAFTTNGSATSEFFLPDSPPIVGVTFYHQMIPWEIANGTFTTITATNALQLTAGAF